MSPGLKTLTAWSRPSPSPASPSKSGSTRRRVLAHDLLGPDRLVALAPALGGVVHDLLAQLEDAVHERLGARRAAGHVHVDGHELVGRDDRVVVEDAHRRGAGAHRDRPLRLEHLVVDAADDRGHLDRHAARDDHQVGLARRGAERLRADACGVHAAGDDGHHLDRAAGQAERRREHAVGARPVQRAVQRRGHDALGDVLLERCVLQIRAPEEILGALLVDTQLGRVADLLAADYLHSSAPLRQTYTNATVSSAMKTQTSMSANVPNARSCTATG